MDRYHYDEISKYAGVIVITICIEFELIIGNIKSWKAALRPNNYTYNIMTLVFNFSLTSGMFKLWYLFVLESIPVVYGFLTTAPRQKKTPSFSPKPRRQSSLLASSPVPTDSATQTVRKETDVKKVTDVKKETDVKDMISFDLDIVSDVQSFLHLEPTQTSQWFSAVVTALLENEKLRSTQTPKDSPSTSGSLTDLNLRDSIQKQALKAQNIVRNLILSLSCEMSRDLEMATLVLKTKHEIHLWLSIAIFVDDETLGMTKKIKEVLQAIREIRQSHGVASERSHLLLLEHDPVELSKRITSEATEKIRVAYKTWVLSSNKSKEIDCCNYSKDPIFNPVSIAIWLGRFDILDFFQKKRNLLKLSIDETDLNFTLKFLFKFLKKDSETPLNFSQSEKTSLHVLVEKFWHYRPYSDTGATKTTEVLDDIFKSISLLTKTFKLSRKLDINAEAPIQAFSVKSMSKELVDSKVKVTALDLMILQDQSSESAIMNHHHEWKYHNHYQNTAKLIMQELVKNGASWTRTQSRKEMGNILLTVLLNDFRKNEEKLHKDSARSSREICFKVAFLLDNGVDIKSIFPGENSDLESIDDSDNVFVKLLTEIAIKELKDELSAKKLYSYEEEFSHLYFITQTHTEIDSGATAVSSQNTVNKDFIASKKDTYEFFSKIIRDLMPYQEHVNRQLRYKDSKPLREEETHRLRKIVAAAIGENLRDELSEVYQVAKEKGYFQEDFKSYKAIMDSVVVNIAQRLGFTQLINLS